MRNAWRFCHILYLLKEKQLFFENIHPIEIFSQLGVDFLGKVYIIYSVEIEKETLDHVTSI